VVPELYLQSYPWVARIGRDIDLGLRRIPGDKRLNVFHYPLQSFEDALLVDLLVGQSLALQLRDLAGSSYAPLAAVIDRLAVREAMLAALAEPMLQAAAARSGSKAALQVALDYWYPRAAATFGRLESQRFVIYQRYNLRKETNQTLLGRWRSAIEPVLRQAGLAVSQH
jgi:1,2-phenylacetyl-CoA epoxidase catalytic subunit